MDLIKLLRTVRVGGCLVRSSNGRFSSNYTTRHQRVIISTRCSSNSSNGQQQTSQKQKQMPLNEEAQARKKKLSLYIALIATCAIGYHALPYVLKPASKVSKKTKRVTRYTADDVRSHGSIQSGVWVTLGHIVYDISDYVQSHPGGGIILQAGGGSLEPFWEKYPVHKQQEVEETLESYKIGVISADDSKVLITETRDKMEKFRHSRQIPIRTEDYVLKIEPNGANAEPVRVSLEEIKRLPKQSLEANLKCKTKEGGQMATGQNIWSGVWVRDVLQQSNIICTNKDKKYLHFIGHDEGYSAKIPFKSEVMQKDSKVLLAYEVNGKELEPEQGYPLRAIISTDGGFKSVKWLAKIVIREEK